MPRRGTGRYGRRGTARSSTSRATLRATECTSSSSSSTFRRKSSASDCWHGSTIPRAVEIQRRGHRRAEAVAGLHGRLCEVPRRNQHVARAVVHRARRRQEERAAHRLADHYRRTGKARHALPEARCRPGAQAGLDAGSARAHPRRQRVMCYGNDGRAELPHSIRAATRLLDRFVLNSAAPLPGKRRKLLSMQVLAGRF